MLGGPLLIAAAILIILAFIIFAFIIYKGIREKSMVNRRFSSGPKGGVGFRGLGANIVERFTNPEAIRSHLEKDSELTMLLWQANIRSASQKSAYYIISTMAPFFLSLCVIIYHFIGDGFRHVVLALIIAVIVGLLLPKRVVAFIARDRKQKIKDELPIFVQILKLLFDAGLAVEQGLRIMVKESSSALPEITKEMDFVLRRSSGGLELGGELDHAARLLNVEEFSDVINILKQMIKQGGSARASLIKLGELIEDRRATTLQEKVQKMAAKMAMVMVVFMFPALLIIVAAPGFMAITKAFGHMK